MLNAAWEVVFDVAAARADSLTSRDAYLAALWAAEDAAHCDGGWSAASDGLPNYVSQAGALRREQWLTPVLTAAESARLEDFLNADD